MPGVSLLAAVAFLTRLPVGRAVRVSADDVARGAVFFPLVGAGIGAAGAGVALALHQVLPSFLAAALSVAFIVALTGALHVDALADTVDAAGGLTRERSLEIMRDSRLGTFGAAAVYLDLLIRTAAVAQLIVGGGALAALVAAGALSRASSAALAGTLPYARATGAVLTGRRVLWALPVGVALAAVALRLDALPITGAAAAVTVVLGLVYRRWLGGVTGDTLGAASETTELVALVVAVALQ